MFGQTANKISGLRASAEQAGQSLPALVWAAEQAVETILSGEHQQKKSGPGERFWQFREYDPADRPQDIDWRQSAKGDPVFVREKEKQTAQNTLFWCASDASMAYRSDATLPTKKEAAQTLCLALSILLTRGHETIELLGGAFRAGRTEKTLQLFAENLYEAEPQTLRDIHFLEKHKNTAFVMASDFLDDPEDIKNTIQAAASLMPQGLLIQILDPAEIELPFDGRIVFESPDNQKKEIIENAGSIRERYQIRIQNHIQQVQEIAHKQQWYYVLHRTDQPISETLMHIWAMLGEKR